MNKAANSRYEGFEHPGHALAKFLLTADIFSIMLKDGMITHFTPDNPEHFLEWLQAHQVIDIRRQNHNGDDL